MCAKRLSDRMCWQLGVLAVTVLMAFLKAVWNFVPIASLGVKLTTTWGREGGRVRGFVEREGIWIGCGQGEMVLIGCVERMWIGWVCGIASLGVKLTTT